MTTWIGQASHDERGRYTGGQAGNQTGTELNTRAAYLYNWHTLVRFNDPAQAAKCAQAMADAVGNMNIGYDQGQRNTILPLARAAGWRLGAISSPCECDCSSLVGVCAIAAGAPEGAIFKDGNLCYTGNEVSRLESTGLVSVHTGADFVASTAKWRAGDILVSSSHTVVVTAGAAPSGNGAAHHVSGDVESLARAVINGRYGTGEDRKAALGDKYAAVQARVNELLGSGGVAHTAAPSGRSGGTYRCAVDSLNVRSGPGTGYAVVASYGRGQTVVLDDTFETADGYVWGTYTGRSGKRRWIAVAESGGEDYLVKC